MRKSTIAKQSVGGGASTFAVLLGAEIQRRRIELGLSQGRAAHPMSRSFMSRLERGRLTPSLPSLLIIAGQLSTTVAAILAPVESRLVEEGSDAGQDGARIVRRG